MKAAVRPSSVRAVSVVVKQVPGVPEAWAAERTQIRSVAFQALAVAVAAGDADGHAAAADIRSGHDALIDGLLQAEAGITGQSLVADIGDALIREILQHVRVAVQDQVIQLIGHKLRRAFPEGLARSREAQGFPADVVVNVQKSRGQCHAVGKDRRILRQGVRRLLLPRIGDPFSVKSDPRRGKHRLSVPGQGPLRLQILYRHLFPLLSAHLRSVLFHAVPERPEFTVQDLRAHTALRRHQEGLPLHLLERPAA